MVMGRVNLVTIIHALQCLYLISDPGSCFPRVSSGAGPRMRDASERRAARLDQLGWSRYSARCQARARTPDPVSTSHTGLPVSVGK